MMKILMLVVALQILMVSPLVSNAQEREDCSEGALAIRSDRFFLGMRTREVDKVFTGNSLEFSPDKMPWRYMNRRVTRVTTKQFSDESGNYSFQALDFKVYSWTETVTSGLQIFDFVDWITSRYKPIERWTASSDAASIQCKERTVIIRRLDQERVRISYIDEVTRATAQKLNPRTLPKRPSIPADQ